MSRTSRKAASPSNKAAPANWRAAAHRRIISAGGVGIAAAHRRKISAGAVESAAAEDYHRRHADVSIAAADHIVAGDEAAAGRIGHGCGGVIGVAASDQRELELAGAGEIRAVDRHAALIGEDGALGDQGGRDCQQSRRRLDRFKLAFHDVSFGFRCRVIL